MIWIFASNVKSILLFPSFRTIRAKINFDIYIKKCEVEQSKTKPYDKVRHVEVCSEKYRKRHGLNFHVEYEKHPNKLS